ncbi:MAG: hypothetical protein PHD83_01185 [Caldisericia bacterium]|nr:hypothetical protein [Caldisericia bacterium]
MKEFVIPIISPPAEQAPIEQIDDANWREMSGQAINTGRFGMIFKDGRDGKISDERMRDFLRRVQEKLVATRQFNLAYQIIKSNQQWTDDGQAEKIAQLAYEFDLHEQGEFPVALNIAKEPWGEDSPEYAEAKKLCDQEKNRLETRKRLKKELIVISGKSTFKELRAALDKANPEIAGLFLEELRLPHNFKPETSQDIYDLLYGEKQDQAGDITVLGYFEQRGGSSEDIEDVLPIRFRK